MSKRQITITITVDDLQQYFECSEQEANRIWDEIDDEFDFEETLNNTVMEDFNLLMQDYNWRKTHA